MKKTYLGDGLYADFDGWHVVLSTPRENGTHWVALEPEVVVAFERYIRGLREDAAKERLHNAVEEITES